jgi:hypothetical protein
MTLVIAVLITVISLSILAISFGRSMYRERQRRLEVKSKWSSAPRAGDGNGTH